MIKSSATSKVRIAMTWAITMIAGFFLETQGMAAVTGAAWSRLAEKRIYFGHQSVGYNIIEGMREVMRENPSIRLTIIEGSDASALAAPAFAHGTIGQNTDVDSKLADFAKHLEKGIGEKADFAFMKFCYVDITEKSDAKSIFIRYRETMESLKKKYPGITFIHVTAPLTSKPRDLTTLAKNLLKRIIGRPVRTHRDNIPRTAFNEMMLQAYQGREPIFDLARIESTDREGKRLVLKEGDKSFYAFVPEYTSDGGHLNEQGRRIAAAELLRLLAELAAER